MTYPVNTHVWCDAVKGRFDYINWVRNKTVMLPQIVLDITIGFLDRIEVGTIRWQEENKNPSLLQKFNQFSYVMQEALSIINIDLTLMPSKGSMFGIILDLTKSKME